MKPRAVIATVFACGLLRFAAAAGALDANAAWFCEAAAKLQAALKS
jgi:hypothetical protein